MSRRSGGPGRRGQVVEAGQVHEGCSACRQSPPLHPAATSVVLMVDPASGEQLNGTN